MAKTMRVSQIKKKIKDGEWEAMQDIPTRSGAVMEIRTADGRREMITVEQDSADTLGAKLDAVIAKIKDCTYQDADQRELGKQGVYDPGSYKPKIGERCLNRD